MTTEHRPNLQKKTYDRWATLSPAEKQEEFRQLVDSHYWHFLPEDIQSRIRSLLSH